jgi:cobalt transporter subunit CbtA
MLAFRSIVFSSALAGLIVGLVVTVAQHFGTIPLILAAEVYEQAAAAGQTDSAEAAAPAASAAHEHDHAAADAWEPADGFQRNALTALFNVIGWIGFGLLLTGLLVLLRRPVTWREGFLWGLGGFAVFVLAPGLGLPPELPGMPAAPLGPRQIWWIATALATGIALWLIVFTRSPLAAVVAVVLLMAPHLMGAPALDEIETNVPELLSHEFIVAVTLTTLLSWTLLGGLTGYFYQRFVASG